MRVGGVIEVVSPEDRRVGRRHDRVLVALEDAVGLRHLPVGAGDEGLVRFEEPRDPLVEFTLGHAFFGSLSNQFTFRT